MRLCFGILRRSVSPSGFDFLSCFLYHYFMKQCAFCEKTHMMGGKRKLLRGHYNPVNWLKKKPNLQWSILPKTGKRILACTRCIRTFSKTR
ncbi:hypothetical protein A3A21_01080 [Candidatus Jorgensenbacteria bacterium RIFCSPLOWO2_01_FULL_45_25b]|uniref:50S ribosomal protein L28 n=1 Tax=Candidatus Jorgensenbacteria bacterium RIFCSPLOWO2_01_FULL_45_25b TaxID=1798471 RepID=A0A1F6BVF8_9BACT|nr:MAG: hypothetical protein A3A21_01080 [Candidatus Jorgensenbacteria bacterium RIFCSPLOWO2_01_FULL_45_25b]